MTLQFLRKNEIEPGIQYQVKIAIKLEEKFKGFLDLQD